MKACRRRHYQNNKGAHIARAKAAKQQARDNVSECVREYFTDHPCVDCGEDDPIVLEFDHVRGKKEFGIGQAKQKSISPTRVKAEIGKCEVRCANCHRRVT